MTLDEAIAHAREKAKEMYLQGMLCHANPNDDKLDGCIECAKEHEQLAEWLEELKDLRELKDTITSNAEVLVRQGYNKAIDDFYILFISEVKNRYPDMPISNFRLQRSVWEMENAKYIECEEIALKIAEQLKEGGADAGSI